MKYFFLVSTLIVFSLIGTSFALTPVYYSENKCDIDNDLKNYREILQDDTVVKTFMQKHPSAISIPATGIDDSDPPQTSVHYLYEDDATHAQLTLRIFGRSFTDPNDCFVPFSYTLNYQNDTKTIQIINYEKDTRELVNFLKGLVPTVPITQNDILANYENSDLILEGKVISLDHSKNQTRYDVEVEHHYKGRLSSKMITVFESTEKPSFEKDDRVILYIQQKNRYLVQVPSFKVDYECNSEFWGSLLAPKYEDILVRGIPATGNFPEFGEPDHVSGLYKAGKEMKITYNVENYGPMIKHTTVKISIFSKQKTVFSEQRSVIAPACSGRVPLSWNFVPESGDHTVHVTVSGTYKVDDKSFQFQEPKTVSDFKARQHWSGVYLDRIVYSDYFSNPDYSVYSLKHKQYEYFIPYKISEGKISDLILDCNVLGMVIHLQDIEDNLTINIPRKLIDAKTQGQDDDFIVLVDGKEADFEEIDPNQESRTLQIQLSKSSTTIEILASNVGMFPEPGFCGMADTDNSQYFRLLSPLQQFKSEIPTDKIQCKTGLVKLEKTENNLVSCVRETSVIPLLLRDWAILGDVTITGGFLEHDIKNGTITSMSFYANKDCAGGIQIFVQPSSNGSLQITIPKKLESLFYKNSEYALSDRYIVYVNGIESAYSDVLNDTARLLKIEFTKNAKNIEIIGTCLI